MSTKSKRMLLGLGRVMAVLIGITVAAFTLWRVARVEQSLSLLHAALLAESESRKADEAAREAKMDELLHGLQGQLSGIGTGSRENYKRLNTRLDQSLGSLSGRLEGMLAERDEPKEAAAPGPVAREDTGPALAAHDLQLVATLSEGNRLLSAGSFRQAALRFSEILRAQPDNSEAHLGHALALYRDNPADSSAFPGIRSELQSYIASYGDSPMALEVLARMSMEEGEWQVAAAFLRRWGTVEPSSVEATKLSGFCALYAGDPGSARDCFVRLRSQAPGDAESLGALGDCQARLGDTTGAEASWEAALAVYRTLLPPEAATTMAIVTKLARSTYERHDYSDSLAYTQEGEAYRHSDTVLAYMAMNLCALGKKEEGIKILDHLSHSPDLSAAALAQKALAQAAE